MQYVTEERKGMQYVTEEIMLLAYTSEEKYESYEGENMKRK